MNKSKQNNLDIVGRPALLLNSPWGQAFIILVFGLMAHGLLLLTDYQVWDGWITGCLVKHPENWNYFCEWIKDCGSNLAHLFFIPLKGVDNIYFFGKLLSVLFWILTYICICFTIPKIFNLPFWIGLYVGVLGVTMPFFEMFGELTFLGYTMPLLFFWIGWFLFASHFGRSFQERIFFRVIYILFIFVGFQFNSLLVLHYALLLVFYISWSISNTQLSLKICFRKLLCHFDMILLPFVFWIYKIVFTPTRNYYAETGYNSFQKSLENYYSGFSLSIIETLKRFLSPFDSFTVLACCAVVFTGLLMFAISLSFLKINHNITKWQIFLLIFGGGFLFLSALFPYVAVGKTYQAFGYDSRNGINLGFCIAFTLTGIAVVIANLFPVKFKTPLTVCLILIFSSLGIVESNRNYLRVSGYAAKQKSILIKIKEEIRKDPKVNVVHLRDYYQLSNSITWIPAAAWTFMFLDGETDIHLPEILVVDTRNFMPDTEILLPNNKKGYSYPRLEFNKRDIDQFKYLTSLPEAMNQIPNEGTTLNLGAFKGTMIDSDPETIGWEYLKNRYFAVPANQMRFLNEISEIKRF